MVSRREKTRSRGGFSLVSVMIAMAVLLAALIGSSNFSYYCTRDAQKAATKIAASRIGLMLCENWRGLRGAETYDPATSLGSALTITPSDGPEKLEDFTLLGSYTITLDGMNYYATLSWKDVSVGLRTLNIMVVWAQRQHQTSGLEDADRLFKLTTYTIL
jgi:hypothetical protein